MRLEIISRDPVITSTASTPAVMPPTNPSGPSRRWRHGPASATTASPRAITATVPTSTPKAGSVRHHGTRFAGYVATGTQARKTLTRRSQTRMRTRAALAGPTRRSASSAPPNTTSQMELSPAKNQTVYGEIAWAAASRSARSLIRSVADAAPTSTGVIGDPTNVDGLAIPSRLSTVGARSVTWTRPG